VGDILDLDHHLLAFFLQVFDLLLLDVEKLDLDEERDSAGVSLFGESIDCSLEVGERRGLDKVGMGGEDARTCLLEVRREEGFEGLGF